MTNESDNNAAKLTAIATTLSEHLAANCDLEVSKDGIGKFELWGRDCTDVHRVLRLRNCPPMTMHFANDGDLAGLLDDISGNAPREIAIKQGELQLQISVNWSAREADGHYHVTFEFDEG